MVPTFPWRAHTPTNRAAMELPSNESSDRAARRGSAAAPAEPRARTLNSRPPSHNGSRRPDRRICGDRGSLSCAPTLWKGVQEGFSGSDIGLSVRSSMASTTRGCSIAAMSCMRPPQCGHARTSTAKTRRVRSAHRSRCLEGRARENCAGSACSEGKAPLRAPTPRVVDPRWGARHPSRVLLSRDSRCGPGPQAVARPAPAPQQGLRGSRQRELWWPLSSWRPPLTGRSGRFVGTRRNWT